MLASALTVFGSLLLAASPTTPDASRVKGDYVEARTADVYTGPCFSNAEIFIPATKRSWPGR